MATFPEVVLSVRFRWQQQVNSVDVITGFIVYEMGQTVQKRWTSDSRPMLLWITIIITGKQCCEVIRLQEILSHIDIKTFFTYF